MINNVTLKRICNLFNFDEEKLCAVFKLGQCDMSVAELDNLFKDKNSPHYRELLDVELAAFLNGLITDMRGATDGPARQPEEQLNNNAVFNKLKIALSLKADEVIDILALGQLTLGKYELSAFFRNVNHKHYRDCSDAVLSAFLSGLKAKFESA